MFREEPLADIYSNGSAEPNGEYLEITNPKTEKSRRPLTRTFLIPHSPKNSKTGGNPATDPNLLRRPN
jgi:hypothetical protein